MQKTFIQTGTSFRVYDDSVTAHEVLPARTYRVCFSPQSGYWLQQVEDLLDREDRAYGPIASRVERVLHTWGATDRSLGVLFSGDRGMGKTKTLRRIAEGARTRLGLPVVVADTSYPGIVPFLESLGPIVLVLDEFEKTFPADDEEGRDHQSQFLALFDGTGAHKMMFLVTVNELRWVNQHMVNRPGRFHYHMRFGYPDAAEIEAYLTDHVPDLDPATLASVVELSRRLPINYDHLRSIAFELTTYPGQKLSDFLGDLNIKAASSPCVVTFVFAEGTLVEHTHLDLSSSVKQYVHLTHNGERGSFLVDAGSLVTEADHYRLEVDPEESERFGLGPVSHVEIRLSTTDQTNL